MIPFRLTKSEVVPLTPQLAQEFSDLIASPTERDIQPTRVDHLRDKADRGLLVTFHWALAKLGDQTFRVNGQHSVTMLNGLNGMFPSGLFVHMDEYEVDDMQGLALLFRQFDDRKSGRTPADVAGAYQGLEPDLRDLSKPTSKLACEGVTYYRRYQLKVKTPIGDGQYELMHDSSLHPFFFWLNDLITIKTPELKKVPVIAAMHASFEKNETEARRFWLEVSRGGKEYEENAPSTILAAWLTEAIDKEEKPRKKTKLKPGDFYRGSVYAWNADREQKPLKNIRSDEASERDVSD